MSRLILNAVKIRVRSVIGSVAWNAKRSDMTSTILTGSLGMILLLAALSTNTFRSSKSEASMVKSSKSFNDTSVTDGSKGGTFAYVGTYTGPGKGDGIYIYRVDTSSGKLTHIDTATGIENPTFLAIHPNKRFLYAIGEVGEFAGKPGGVVTSFAIDPDTAALTMLNQQSSEGPGPCHISVDQTGRWALVANYSGGSVTMLPIADNGELGEATDFIQHKDPSTADGGQKAPRAHSITVDPSNRFAFAADLGLDKVMMYRMDLDNGKLIPNNPPWVKVEDGSGPRHFAFHPNGQFAYLINEHKNTFTTFAYDQKKGILTETQTISTLPDDFDDKSYCADVHVAASGKFVYGSNRGYGTSSIAVFSVDQCSGALNMVELEPTQGDFPRNFAIDPSGEFMYVENQLGNNIVLFRIDPTLGKLSATGDVTEVPMPVCMKLVQLP